MTHPVTRATPHVLGSNETRSFVFAKECPRGTATTSTSEAYRESHARALPIPFTPPHMQNPPPEARHPQRGTGGLGAAPRPELIPILSSGARSPPRIETPRGLPRLAAANREASRRTGRTTGAGCRLSPPRLPRHVDPRLAPSAREACIMTGDLRAVPSPASLGRRQEPRPPGLLGSDASGSTR